MHGHSLSDRLRAISDELVRARATGNALPGPPAGLPESLDDAYLIQDRSIGCWRDDVRGWKVGGVPAAYADRYDEKYLSGPIFASGVQMANGSGPVAMPVFVGGFAAIEPEFVVMIGETEQQDRLFIGAEIASSPIPDINDYGPCAVISDFGNNNGLLVGSEIPDWRTLAEPVRVTTFIDGEKIAAKDVSGFPGPALEALAFLRALAAKRGYDLPAGTYVSTGAITGVHEAAVGAQSVLDFGDLGSIELELVGVERK